MKEKNIQENDDTKPVILQTAVKNDRIYRVHAGRSTKMQQENN